MHCVLCAPLAAERQVTHVEEDVLELQDLLSVLRAEPRI